MRRSEVAPSVMAVVDRNLDFTLPAEVAQPRSLIVVAVPHACARVTVVVAGETVNVPIPTTYCHHDEIQAEVARTIAASLAPAGLAAAPMLLPEKLLAVCAGLARYGRNNIAYVDGWGSFVELVTCVSELAPGADPWTGPRALARCEACEACRRACPSGAIGEDRFLVHGELCLTLHNESEQPFPQWIRPAWHNCLVGCLRCQRVCPEDLALRDAVAETAAFDERETGLLVGGVTHELLAREAGLRDEARRARPAELRRRVSRRGAGAQPARAARGARRVLMRRPPRGSRPGRASARRARVIAYRDERPWGAAAGTREVRMDVGRVLKDSWVIFAKDWAALIVGALITFVLGAVTLGILAVPLSAGLYLMLLRRVREGRKAEVGDVFGCFDRLGAYLVAYLLLLALGLVVAAIVLPPFLLLVLGHSGARGLGFVLLGLALLGVAVVGAYLLTIWVYWTILMVDRRRSVIEALKESREIVTRSGFWMTLLVIVVVGIIVGAVNSAVSTVTFGIGGILAFLLTPWQCAAYAAMYFQAVGEGALLPSAIPGPTSVWQGGPAAYGGPGGPYPFGGAPVAGPYGPPPGYPPPPGYAPPAAPPLTRRRRPAMRRRPRAATRRRPRATRRRAARLRAAGRFAGAAGATLGERSDHAAAVGPDARLGPESGATPVVVKPAAERSGDAGRSAHGRARAGSDARRAPGARPVPGAAPYPRTRRVPGSRPGPDADAAAPGAAAPSQPSPGTPTPPTPPKPPAPPT